jgi:hypothetical protein
LRRPRLILKSAMAALFMVTVMPFAQVHAGPTMATPAIGSSATPGPSMSAKPPNVALDFSADNLRDIYTVAAGAQAQLDEIRTISQWLIGVAALVIAAVTFGGTTYIRREASKAAEEAREAALAEIANIKRQLERSRSDLDFRAGAATLLSRQCMVAQR